MRRLCANEDAVEGGDRDWSGDNSAQREVGGAARRRVEISPATDREDCRISPGSITVASILRSLNSSFCRLTESALDIRFSFLADQPGQFIEEFCHISKLLVNRSKSHICHRIEFPEVFDDDLANELRGNLLIEFLTKTLFDLVDNGFHSFD